MNFYQFMDIYEDVFSPLYYMFFCALILIYLESKWSDRLWKGVAVAIVAYAIAYATYSIWYFFPPAPQWIEDLLAVTGLMIAVGIALLALRKKIYGELVEKGIYILIVLTVPYMAISPFWNISGHVAYTTAPSLYLGRVNKKLYVLMLVPLIMMINRPIVGAHTVLESIGGFVLAAISVVVGTYLYDKGKIKKDDVLPGTSQCSITGVHNLKNRHPAQETDEHKLPR